MTQSRKRYTVQMIGGSHLGNARATHQWWLPAERVLHGLGAAERPVYFVSSNTHSIVNVLSGTARRRKDDLTAFIRGHGSAELREELAQLEAGTSRSNWENLLYFAAGSTLPVRTGRLNAGSEARKSRPLASITSTPAARSTSASRSSS